MPRRAHPGQSATCQTLWRPESSDGGSGHSSGFPITLPMHPVINLKSFRFALIGCLLTACAAAAGPPTFVNHGTLEGFTGANQRTKVTETTLQDHGSNGTSLQCLMLRDEPDVPTGGCHAEAHLNRFPTGEPLGKYPGFEATTRYQVKFDQACNAATVGFFQIKNCGGPQRWDYLIAMWRSAGQNGSDITFQVNPDRKNHIVHARLDSAKGTALVADRWHEIVVKGNFTKDPNGWVEVIINGQPVEWYADAALKQRIGTRITGVNLPDLPGSEWQLQLGGYAFFKDKTTRRASVFVDDITATRP